MTESLRALLAGAIDYAGMFPPAGLPLEQALAKYREHRRGPEAWMVARFVCPAERLGELAPVYSLERDGKLAVIIPWGDTGEAGVEKLTEAMACIGNFPIAGATDSLEFRWQGDFRRVGAVARYGELVKMANGVVGSAKRSPAMAFFELPPFEPSRGESAWLFWVGHVFRTLYPYYLKAKSSKPSRVGFKLRCGGAEPSAVPSLAEVCAVICACRDAGVFWKSTAGLHHPFRHFDPALGVPVHGFLNLLTAAVMADIHRLEAERVRAMLEDDDPWHFRFTNEALTWREFSATVPQITAARERSLRSFGSCSIDEPWHDLSVLGLL
jgi:hypothetical protein